MVAVPSRGNVAKPAGRLVGCHTIGNNHYGFYFDEKAEKGQQYCVYRMRQMQPEQLVSLDREPAVKDALEKFIEKKCKKKR